MVAPGDNLEFQASTFFSARAKRVPNLLERVAESVKNEPNRGKLLCGTVRELELDLDGQSFLVFLARHGNRISLMQVFQSNENEKIELQRKRFIHLFGKGGAR